jgi:hypothetical protein
MTDKEFNTIVDETFTTCERLLTVKKFDYAGGDRDRLHNFKVIARRRGITSEMACNLLTLKHETALDDYVDDIDRGVVKRTQEWREKILDIINYHVLLLALVIERHNSGPVVDDDPVLAKVDNPVERDDCGKIDSRSLSKSSVPYNWEVLDGGIVP